MIIPLSWLSEIIGKTLDSKRVVTAMEAAGIEVEGVEVLKALDSKIIVAEVVKLQAHPNADRLQLATINTGKTKVQVVCGAPNVASRQKVVLAQVGSQLPNGTKVGLSTIRGQESAGMLCSEQELGLSENHDGILVLAADVVVGSRARTIFGGAETLIDISTAANRADLLSMVGVAREVAVHLGLKIKHQPPTMSAKLKPASLVKKTEHDGTSRYSLIRLHLPRTDSSSPAWLAQRLQLIGIRPVSLVVDITNYVLFEVGQPLHAFDAEKIEGKLGVRQARSYEKIVTLDGVQRKLGKQDLVIADGQKAVAIAGVMGGKDSEVSKQTKDILLEIATFDGSSIRKTAQSQGLRSEASARFERGLPTQLADVAIAMVIKLFKQLCGAKVVGFDEYSAKVAKPSPVVLDAARFYQISGLNNKVRLPLSEMRRLGFGIEAGKQLIVQPPYWRQDITLEEDVYEELIKLIGLENVPSTLPALRLNNPSFDDFWPRIWMLRAALTGLGQFEISTYPFISEKVLQLLNFKLASQPKLQNPRSPQQAYLRPSLLPGMLEAATKNSHVLHSAVMYEIAKVYSNQKATTLPHEELKLGCLAYGTASYAEVMAGLESIAHQLHTSFKIEPLLVADYLHPTRQAAVIVEGKRIGLIGELHPGVATTYKLKEAAYMQLDVAMLLAYWQIPQLHAPPQYPPARRDLTIIIDAHVGYQTVANLLTSSALRVRFGGDFYDTKLGAGKKALTLQLELSSDDHTLDEAEIKQAESAIVAKLRKHFGASIQA